MLWRIRYDVRAEIGAGVFFGRKGAERRTALALFNAMRVYPGM
jgi:hypothetical protein